MKKIIFYILYKESGLNSQKDWTCIRNDRVEIHILKINPYEFTGICGQRCHKLYIDAEFTKNRTGQEMIDNIFKPMAGLKGSFIEYI